MKEQKEFLAESKQLLDLMINSIYSNQEVFLRELISNASDAIDKYQFLGLTNSATYPKCDHEIRISPDKDQRILTISDTGIGMTKEDLENNLGTIAKSGSKEFLKQYQEAKNSGEANIIGQFGVGFYSVFMVAKKVEVISKTVDSPTAFIFSSEGVDTYTLEDTTNFHKPHGTEINIYLKDDKDDQNYSKYLTDFEIKDLVKKYSDFIRHPIKLLTEKTEGQEETFTDETLNSMIPLWKKNRKDIKEEELTNFYNSRFGDYEKPFLSLPIKVEGTMTYDALLFIPGHAPYDLYSENYERGLALYSKGVYIKEKCEELIPDYLKFVKGLIDCDDLPLNLSREMLQNSSLIRKIANNIENRLVEKLKDIYDFDKKKYYEFYKHFGLYIKYGIYHSFGEKKELLQDLLAYQTLLHNDYISLKEYVDKKKGDQKYIYYACGKTAEEIKLLPQIEKYKKDGVDVLLLTEKIDEFTLVMLKEFSNMEFKNIASENVESGSQEELNKVDQLKNKYKDVITNLKDALKDKVDDVIISHRLVEAPVCITTKDGLSLSMEQNLNDQLSNKNNPDMNKVKAYKVLEVNAEHDLFNKAISGLDDAQSKYYASILYDEAMLLEGFDIDDKREFITKLNKLIVNSNLAKVSDEHQKEKVEKKVEIKETTNKKETVKKGTTKKQETKKENEKKVAPKTKNTTSKTSTKKTTTKKK